MDDVIIKLIKMEKDEGIGLLKENYSGLLYYIVGNILKNPQTMEECINDIYIKVWRSIGSFEAGRSKFSTWLTTIARNTALNYLRGMSISFEELKEETADKSSLEDEVLCRERINELKVAISTLSFEEQNLFYRKYYYLQSTAQIGAELGRSERSVEGRLYRLRKKLQNKLGGEL